MSLMFQVEVFWVVMPCSVVVEYRPEDGGSMDIRNVGNLPQHNPEDLDLKHHLRDSLKTRIRSQKGEVGPVPFN
jgi:hypothetical protein